ncbi:MAG: hypothetical protein M1828_001841 [Chrysothrix sp. TS-e1954]|nr:MAG: hypothetical protein M1828_001841 [Chrysothrix sp. TS-e1954]
MDGPSHSRSVSNISLEPFPSIDEDVPSTSPAPGSVRLLIIRRNVRIILPTLALGSFISMLWHSLPPKHPPIATATASLAFVIPAYFVAELLYPFLNEETSLQTDDDHEKSNDSISVRDSIPKILVMYLITQFLFRGNLNIRNVAGTALVAYVGNIFEAQGDEIKRLWSTFKKFLLALLVFFICPLNYDWIPALFRNMYMQMLFVAWFDLLHIRLKRPFDTLVQRAAMFGAVVGTTMVVMVMFGQYSYLYNPDLPPRE